MGTAVRPAPLRRTGSLLGLVGFELAAVVGLHWLGRLPGLRIRWEAPVPWLLSSPVQEVLAAVLRMVGLVMAYWLLASTLLYLLASLTRLPAAIRAVSWATIPLVRRVADHAVAVTLATSMVGGSTLGVAGPAMATDSRGGMGPPARKPVAAAQATGSSAQDAPPTTAGDPAYTPDPAGRSPTTTSVPSAAAPKPPPPASEPPTSEAPTTTQAAPTPLAAPPGQAKQGAATETTTHAYEFPVGTTTTTTTQAPTTTTAPGAAAPKPPPPASEPPTSEAPTTTQAAPTAPAAPPGQAKQGAAAPTTTHAYEFPVGTTTTTTTQVPTTTTTQATTTTTPPATTTTPPTTTTKPGTSGDTGGTGGTGEGSTGTRAPQTEQVASGDNLWSIARDHLAKAPGGGSDEPTNSEVAAYWTQVKEANQDRLRDPDLIKPGQMVVLPPIAPPPAGSASKTGRETHEVVEGDNLWSIARDHLAKAPGGGSDEPTNSEVAAYWTQVKEANQDRLRDPDLIKPGQAIVLPPTDPPVG
jgi:LysM domain